MAQFAKNMFDLWPLLAVLLLLASFGPWLGNAKKRRPKPEPEFRLDEAAELDARKFEGGKCAFFCFFVPLEDDKLIDLHIYKNMSCSDIVYGFAQVQDEDLRLPTKQDLLRHSYYGNFKLITSLQRISSSPRVHLGMKLSPDARFLNSVDNVELAANISRRMAFYARRYGFSGIFLKFDSEVLMSPAFAQFAELLSDELKAEQKRTGARKLDLILSISSNWVRYVYRRMPRFDSFFDTFYLWADEIDSAGHELPAKAIPVDPLHHSAQVSRADSLAENAERLAGTGVSRRKIIIGLSAWARSYVLHNADDPTTVPAEVADFGFPGEETQQTDGKLAYQEICQLIEEEPLQHDNMSETVSLRQGDLWYSFNEPEHPALVQKLEWIANHEFGGVGLYSLQADDPNGNCSRRGMLPLHRSVASHFKCRRGTKRGNSEQLGECMRLCMFDMDEDAGGASNNFHFEQLRPGWCSHLVLGQATVNPFMTANFGPSKGMRRALSMYNDWERERKPFLILSFTGTADQWRLATMATARYMLIEGIRRLLDEHNADGVDLNCENGGPDGPNQAFQMIQFLADLRRTLGNKKQILLSLNPNSFIDNRFDFPAMERSVDFFVAVGYRYHRYTNAYTGHHSPLFKNSTLLNQPKMTIQGTVEEMLAGEVPREKLIVALSAEAMSQHFVDDIRTHRSWESRKIGESAARIHNRNRAHGAGTVSQTEVCELMKKETTVSHFLNELGVPYLVNDEREFIAFDSKRSIQIKTVWLSLQGLAGVGLHGLQLDNIAGECPLGEPFPLLRTIVQSQICAKCPPSTAKDPTMPTTSTQLMSTEIPTSTVEGLSTSTDYPDLPTAEEGGMGSTSASPAADESTPSPRAANFAHCRLSGSRPAAGDNSSASQFLTHCAVTWASLGKNLSVDELPLERCDSLLLTGWAKLDGQGVASAENGNDESKAQMLAKLAEMARDNGTELWAEVPCAMEPRQWAALLDEKREQVASSLAQMLISKNLSGLLLDCDHLMAPAHRTSFSQLLNEINAEMAERSEQQAAAADKEEDDKAKCTSRLALRMQLSRSNISEVYVPEQLNQLLKHVFLPSGVATSKAMAKLLNPLFALGIANQEGTDTQNGTFNVWLADGLQPKLVVMELPAHAIRQKREQEEAEPETVGQEKVCQFMRKPGAQHFTRYDAVAAYWKTKDDWLSAENAATIKYKVQFAMQHRLGGFLLRSLDADDPDDRCNNGAGFPLLAAARAASCDQPKAAMQAKTRHGRDMLGTMVFSRGRR